jgi:hypothetical protein
LPGFTGAIEPFPVDKSTLQLLIAQRLRRQEPVGAAKRCGPDKATELSVYPGIIEPAKPTRWKRSVSLIGSSGWTGSVAGPAETEPSHHRALALELLPAVTRGVNHQSARDFIAWAQEAENPEPWQLDIWHKALRWFFRTAKPASVVGRGSRNAGSARNEHSPAAQPQDDASVNVLGKEIPAWKAVASVRLSVETW